MIEFEKLDPAKRDLYNQYLMRGCRQGCEYSFVNLSLWGRQRAAVVEDFLVLFSQFGQRSIYPFPVGQGDLRPVLDAIIQDARHRGIPCRLSSMTKQECDTLETLYPGRFHFYTDRDTYDYVYRIEDLAQLKGKRYQSKRNFCNRFWTAHPECRAVPLDPDMVRAMADQWFAQRQSEDPLRNFHLEQVALDRALRHMDELGLEGLMLLEQGQVLAFTMGSRLCCDTFDVHFEKALDADGAYAAINQAFARHLHAKYPELQYLNREDDLGLAGLRKAKLSYHPDHLVEKYWARLWEADDEN